MKLVLIGAPAAGKGTQAKRLIEHYNIAHISTGDMLREEISKGTELGEKVKSVMASGGLVSDDLIIEIVKARIAEDDCKNGFIFDGFPRTVVQAEKLDEIIGHIDRAVFINAPDEVMLQRLTARETCPKCGAKAKRETDTMPNWAGSSWYFLRFMDPHNDHEFASMQNMKYWNKVNWYNGGMEHTARHLLYARFWVQFLYNIGLVPNKEMIDTRVSHGMVLGSDNQKMSKSKGNVINPDDIVREYGADTLRVYEMFMGDYEQDSPWSTDSLRGCKRFIDKVIRLKDKVIDKEEYSKGLEIIINKSIKKVEYDLTHLGYNTAVSTLMILANKYDEEESITKKDYQVLLTLLNPIAPHITEELWNKLGHENTIAYEKWPEYDESKIVEDVVEIPIQINGKVKATINIPVDLDESEVKEIVHKNDNIINFVTGKTIVKEIYVKNKIYNIVVK